MEKFGWKSNIGRENVKNVFFFNNLCRISDSVIRNSWKVLKCGAGEGGRRSVGPIM